MSIDVISGFMADFLRLIDVNAGGLRLKKVPGILHLTENPKNEPKICESQCFGTFFGRTFLRLFGDFGAWGSGDSCAWGLYS